MNIRCIKKSDNYEIEQIIKRNLEMFHLDLPGTVYFDEIIQHLSEDYLGYKQRYYYILEINGKVKGGIGLSELPFISGCCELQKLYLSDDVKGNGYGKLLIQILEQKALELGYTKMYLETHHNLVCAIGLYKTCGFKEIERPDFVQHGTMDVFFIKDLQ